MASSIVWFSGSCRWHTFDRSPSGALLWLHSCREHLDIPSSAECWRAADPLALFLTGADWVAPALWVLTSQKYPQSWSLGFAEAVNPTLHLSHIQGRFTRLWVREGFILIRDAVREFMTFSCLQPSTKGKGSWLSPNAVTWRNYFRRRRWKFGWINIYETDKEMVLIASTRSTYLIWAVEVQVSRSSLTTKEDNFYLNEVKWLISS